LVLDTAVLGATAQQAAGAQTQVRQEKAKKSEKVVVEGQPGASDATEIGAQEAGA
jgi:hypothetical protein